MPWWDERVVPGLLGNSDVWFFEELLRKRVACIAVDRSIYTNRDKKGRKFAYFWVSRKGSSGEIVDLGGSS